MGADPSYTAFRFTVEQFYKMGEAGIFREHERIELIDGELITMPPIGSRHAYAVDALMQLLVQRLHGSAWVSCQNPAVLGEYSLPQPDLMALRLKAPAQYRDALPRPEDVLVVVEVADTTLRFDRRIKMPLYARHGIHEAWIVNLRDGVLEIYQAPSADGYTVKREATPAQRVALQALPSVEIDWSAALG